MSDFAADLTDQQLQTVGNYVRHNLREWMEQVPTPPSWAVPNIQLLERMVRVETKLQAQSELMQQGFAAMEKRTEAVEKRIEVAEIGTRWLIGIGFVVISTLIAVFALLA
ncbi:MAG: hypothetical protein KOO61_00900 [Spirochaetales bacterium]|nr:hypothetical protein [Spirochaetales bacterium]